MVCLLVFIIVLHLVSLAMLLIATLEKSWWIWADSEITDLWYNCFHDNATDSWLCAATTESDWLQSVQALMVLSVVFSSVSLLVFLGQLFTLTRGSLFYFTALCQAFAGNMNNFTLLLTIMAGYRQSFPESIEFDSNFLKNYFNPLNLFGLKLEFTHSIQSYMDSQTEKLHQLFCLSWRAFQFDH
uniref:Epithelial membrane protein 3-like n=1 Tax=Oryzias melastigma TaxID=30732 RepID=A0A3B3DY47_ORYME